MKSSKYEILLTRGRQDVLDEDKYSLLCTELYTLPDHINKLANVQISRDEIPAHNVELCTHSHQEKLIPIIQHSNLLVTTR